MFTITRFILCFSLLFFVACTTSLVVVPVKDPDGRVPPPVAGIRLMPLAIPYRGGEFDLPAYVLPVPVELRNEGPLTVDVQLADFALVDERGGTAYACAVPEVPREGTPPPPPRGPLLATVARPTPADPDLELKFVGPTAPGPVSKERQLGLPAGPLAPGKTVRGFLFFERRQLGDLRRLPTLRLYFRVRAPKPGDPGQPNDQATRQMIDQIEVRLKVEPE